MENRCSPTWKWTIDSTTIWTILSQSPFRVRECSAFHPLEFRESRACRGSH